MSTPATSQPKRATSEQTTALAAHPTVPQPITAIHLRQHIIKQPHLTREPNRTLTIIPILLLSIFQKHLKQRMIRKFRLHHKPFPLRSNVHRKATLGSHRMCEFRATSPKFALFLRIIRSNAGFSCHRSAPNQTLETHMLTPLVLCGLHILLEPERF